MSVNDEYASELHAPLTTLKGIDELGCVVKRPNECYRICRSLNRKLKPHVFRFCVVRGRVDLRIRSHNAALMDGPAFHTASEGLARVEKLKALYLFELGFVIPGLSEFLSTTANLLQEIRDSWTVSQRRVIVAYEECGNQKRAAQKLRITQQAVSDSLRKSNWNLVRQQEEMLNVILCQEEAYK